MSDAEIDVARRLHELTEAMVISALNASRGNHDPIIMTHPLGSSRRGENSRGKVQNVVTDSTAENSRMSRQRARLAVPEQGLPAMSYVSREDLSHWACFLLDPCQTFVESAMFGRESLVVDPQ